MKNKEKNTEKLTLESSEESTGGLDRYSVQRY